MSQIEPIEKKITRKSALLSREDQVIERRQSLLDAAIAVIARKGLTGITIRKIATEAKCSYGVVSFHFNSKEGIITAALDYLVEEYENLLDINKTRDSSPASRIRTMVETDFDGRIANGKRIAVWISFWAETVRVRSYRERCSEQKVRYHVFTEENVAALARDRSIAVDAEQVARTLNAIIDGFWIANLVANNTGAAAQRAAKQACFAYLHSIFPDDF